jgi:hypothetical protein
MSDEATPRDESDAPDIRWVVLHRPGPAWRPGVDFREQPGVVDHVLHYRKLHDQGKLALGGPFPIADRGGMMIPAPGLGREFVESFANEDPAVKSGLLVAEVVPWFVAMKG